MSEPSSVLSVAHPLLSGRTVRGPASARLVIDGRPYINFYGNGYLALSGVEEIRDAALQALHDGAPFAQQLMAVQGARDSLFDEVERYAALACGTESTVYFASGYLIGYVGLSSLEHAFDLLVLDESAHYSLNDAARLTGRPCFTFAHCDSASLEEVLKKHVSARQRPLLVTDGVFATTGRVPPLPEYAKVLESYDGRLFIDEAHAFGVLGAQGRGAAEHSGIEGLAATGATLSKAYCAQGAIVGCSAAAAARLRALPPLRGANAGSPLSAAAAAASLRYVRNRPELRKELHATTKYLREQLRKVGLTVGDSPAPIVAFQFGSRADMLALQRRAFERGVYLYHSTYIGSGPEGMIRCSVFRDHTTDDIDALISVLRAL